MTPEEVDRAWAQWCRDVEQFFAWFDGDDTGADRAAPASAMEARRAGTQGGPVHDSATAKPGRPETPAPLPMED